MILQILGGDVLRYDENFFSFSLSFNSSFPLYKLTKSFLFFIFKNCLGALDGTHIDVHVPEIDKPRYRTRKGRVATNVLGVCSGDMQFIYVFPGWEGSASDSRVLHDAISRPNGFKVPAGKTIT